MKDRKSFKPLDHQTLLAAWLSGSLNISYLPFKDKPAATRKPRDLLINLRSIFLGCLFTILYLQQADIFFSKINHPVLRPFSLATRNT